MKETFYFTFCLDSKFSKRFVKVENTDSDSARGIMLETFGTKWAFQYDEKRWKEADMENKYGLTELELK